jgi:hypothetical protein
VCVSFFGGDGLDRQGKDKYLFIHFGPGPRPFNVQRQVALGEVLVSEKPAKGKILCTACGLRMKLTRGSIFDHVDKASDPRMQPTSSVLSPALYIPRNSTTKVGIALVAMPGHHIMSPPKGH